MFGIASEDSKNFHDTISKNIRKLRLKKSLTQLDISLLMGFNNPSFITNAESINSNKKFNLTQLHKLSIILEVDICKFFIVDN